MGSIPPDISPGRRTWQALPSGIRTGAVAALLLSWLLLFQGCSPSAKIPSLDELQKSTSGMLEGYLPLTKIPNSLFLLPPPPEEGSAAYALDLEMNRKTLESGDTLRWEQAAQDANLSFPDALKAFTGAVGMDINREDTPGLYLILRRVMTDAVLSTSAAKRHYHRERPFIMNHEPTCSPDWEDQLRKDGSYPSGHTAIGWAWALVLCELFPENADRILDRGRAFGESRMVCNVHWYSDVVAGRIMGAATVARLHADPVFNASMKKARKELARLRRKQT